MMLFMDGKLRPVLKVLTDYPRNDLAHDEVHQALVTACAKRRIDPYNLDVGAITGMDTVEAGFKTAQLALNSEMGFGHVFLTNCAPRKNIESVKSSGEKVVLGITKTGVTMLVVNSGYSLSPFKDLVRRGEMAFFQTKIRDRGSQFRSRDFFPDGQAELAAHLVRQAKEMGPDRIEKLLAKSDYAPILKGLPWLERKLDPRPIPEWTPGNVLYVDSFGNIKLNFHHAALRKAGFRKGEELAVMVGSTVNRNVLMGGKGFSHKEGIFALTEGSSGWPGNAGKGGAKDNFAEVMLRGDRADKAFPGVRPDSPAIVLRDRDLTAVTNFLQAASPKQKERLKVHRMTDASILAMLARSKLIRDGYDAAPLREALKKKTLLRHLRS